MARQVNLATRVASSDAEILEQFNRLNQKVVDDLPHLAQARDLRRGHVEVLKQMRALLSQRPQRQRPASPFKLLEEIAAQEYAPLPPMQSVEDMPTWTAWYSAYKAACGFPYSLRHAQRLMADDSDRPAKRRKPAKHCRWSVKTHNDMRRVAIAAFELVRAREVGAHTMSLEAEILQLKVEIPEEVLTDSYDPTPEEPEKKAAMTVQNVGKETGEAA